MACSSCGTGGGCSTSGNSGCGKSGGCSSGGCNKLNSFDWLGNMEMDFSNRFDIVEVKFKGGRKEYLRNANKIELYSGDAVVVDVPNGHHIGHVSLQGELVRLQLKKKSVAVDDATRVIYRKASPKDLEKYVHAKNREETTLYRTRQLANQFKLNMKLSDVEFQADNSKATFYYSAEERVDFRELIKTLAGEFKVRVEMKQISLRQEAGRLGGIGSCGRELCCSTWITDFKNVNTSAARYQNLALNPAKLSGQCGRLKCCLNFELDTYMNALKGIPEIERPISTLKGDAVLQKTDIFKKIMWFAYRDDVTTWKPISVERVNAILELNKKGEKPASLEIDTEAEKGSSFQEKKEKEELSRFDNTFAKKKNKNNNNKRKNKSSEEATGDSQASGTRPRPVNNENPTPKTTIAPRQNHGENPTPRPNNGGNQTPRPNNAGNPNQNQRPKSGANPNQTPRPNNTGNPNQNQRPKPGANPNQTPRPNNGGNPNQNQRPNPGTSPTPAPRPNPNSNPNPDGPPTNQ